jgi:hypothetical protein
MSGRVRRARTTSEASPAAWPASFRGALIGLRGRAQGTIAFHIGLGHRQREIVRAAVIVKRLDAP